MKRKRLIIFMPSIEGGGVEKNLFIISRYLVKKIKDISLITVSNSFRKKFDKKLKFISAKNYVFLQKLNQSSVDIDKTILKGIICEILSVLIWGKVSK